MDNTLKSYLNHARDALPSIPDSHPSVKALDAAIHIVKGGFVSVRTTAGEAQRDDRRPRRMLNDDIPCLVIPLTPAVEVTDLDKKLARAACLAIYRHHNIPYSDDDRLVPVMEAIAKERADEERRLDDAV